MLSFSVIIIAGCHAYDNFTTYFNTYYNMQRLIKESENEFEWQDESRRIKPRVFIPDPDVFVNQDKRGIPDFCKEFIIDNKKLQPVKIKLDSVEIKGSKILARHPKSDYIEGSLYLMAKAYFYKNEWLPSEIKCGEQIDRFPDGELSPDAHILLVKDYLIQRKFLAAKTLLSRTVDVAWKLNRYDILSEAFRLEAELALYHNDMKEAMRPYKQAIAQTDDGLLKAKWQVELGVLLYRIGQFKLAAKEFALVRKYSPDYMADFEGKLYRANSLAYLGRYDEATDILDDLESDGNNKEWLEYIYAGRLLILMLQDNLYEGGPQERYADTTFVNSPAIKSVYFLKGMDLFKSHDYFAAKRYFGLTRSLNTDFSKTAREMYGLLDDWNKLKNLITPPLRKIQQGENIGDTSRTQLAQSCYEMGRVQYKLTNKDSAMFYFKTAAAVTPLNTPASGKYIFVYAHYMEDLDPIKADSLYEVVALRFPLTDYGYEARKLRGFSLDYIRDTVKHMYTVAWQDRIDKDYERAVKRLLNIYGKYPRTDYAPKSLYAIGWIFEKDLHQVDTALFYYQKLIAEYPNSVYARDIHLSVDYLLALRSGGPLPDSLKPRTRRERVEQRALQFKQPETQQQAQQQNPLENGKINTMDAIKNPGSFFKSLDPMDMLNKKKEDLENKDKEATDPSNLVPTIKLPNLIPESKEEKKDTTEANKPK